MERFITRQSKACCGGVGQSVNSGTASIRFELGVDSSLTWGDDFSLTLAGFSISRTDVPAASQGDYGACLSSWRLEKYNNFTTLTNALDGARTLEYAGSTFNAYYDVSSASATGITFAAGGWNEATGFRLILPKLMRPTIRLDTSGTYACIRLSVTYNSYAANSSYINVTMYWQERGFTT